ncbi:MULTISPECIES: YhcN/YlaJ family sporulation lipoprotein [Bacillus]|uniref:YhcN/YlaJ family sporulation lipoprotein n=1 Tax=Bacillus TaxID=1386 RepID=UPI0012B766AB|nr:YhcN/YlaJ family sporulation lipoprotein [Bacillus haynesii]TWK25757.1 Sporulation cortex protein CoxA [Bacillus licheniformis]MBU8684535.1 YhcN/YlaJ family sporulation lipoprotein [Bacillus haynesii]MCY7798668.1 YhcN/YlaJ family sporulation lipoprotein [Bacillus haynesii]MCY7835125.1 YhcN/YlaJ family sporulation lipoprotein [Bacillus haynesii]MCY7993169.1 YhcN/YlaJ family sporulation lipoprotein [Bacillus haynesii]
MDSKLKVFSGILLLTAGLSACGTNDAIDNGNNTRPIGYYSNDADRNAGLDNEGPVTEMLENMNGRNGATNVNNRAGNGNPVPTGDGTYSRGDMNYHNHLVNTADTGYDRPENRKISRNITGRVNKLNYVDESQAVVTNETVIIAVRSDKRLTNNERTQIRKAAKTFAGDRTVQVVEDDGAFTRLREMNDDPQNIRDRGDTTNNNLNRLRNQ